MMDVVYKYKYMRDEVEKARCGVGRSAGVEKSDPTQPVTKAEGWQSRVVQVFKSEVSV
jgi:hypothetical protein